jgi:uncharacterized SAM-binding protein YcdF (DUF218 family)
MENALDATDLQRIAAYVMPDVPAQRSDLGFLFGTRHGIPAFCDATVGLWQAGMFRRLLVSGGATAGLVEAEADVIGAALVKRGMPEDVLILERAATNTEENVVFGRIRAAQCMDAGAVRSILAIGKVCAARRYLMTLRRHWPGVRTSLCAVNYFDVPAGRWHEDAEFRRRVLAEFEKIPRYLRAGCVQELDNDSADPGTPCAPL